MKGVDDDEETMSKDLNKTEKNISDLKEKARSGGGGFLSILLNPVKAIATIALGALILIALFRIGWKKWKSAYMPQSDGSKMTILGFEIPNWAGIKAFAVGIKNFFKSGIGNWIDRLKLFFRGIWNKLFGKKGIFKDWASVKHTIRRIVLAYGIGVMKKVASLIVSAVCTVVNFIAPGAGTVALFIIKLIPAIVTMIATEVMLLWSKHKKNQELQYAQSKSGQMANTTAALKSLRINIAKASTGVKAFKGQMAVIPGLQTPNWPGKGQRPPQGAIMRQVPPRMH